MAGQNLVPRSVHISGIKSGCQKIKKKNKLVSCLGRSGQSSGLLATAERLEALSNGSLHPVPPSGGSPKALPIG
jgi:hypothetical protein